VIGFTFFWEDPKDISQVDERSYRELFLTATSQLYYRPLHMSLAKALRSDSGSYAPEPFHLINVLGRVLAVPLVYLAARCWFRRDAIALAAALIFLLCPLIFDAVGPAISPHPRLFLLIIASLWLYGLGRQRSQRWPIWLAVLLEIIALLIHEMAILLPIFIGVLEAYWWWERRSSPVEEAGDHGPPPLTGFSIPAGFLLPVVIYLAIWLLIPKSGEESPELRLDTALYLSQSLTFPFAGLISGTGGWGLTPAAQAGLALALTACAFAIGVPPAGRPRLLFGLVSWAAASGLLWLTLSLDYLWTGARLLYIPLFATALAWGSLAGSPTADRRYVFGLILLAAVIGQSAWGLLSLVKLYQHGSDLMVKVMAAAQAHERALFINVPDRFEYEPPLYPIGFWGMVLAPVSQELDDYLYLATGLEHESVSLSDLPLLSPMVAAGPYRVNTRGEDAHATTRLYESIRWADQTFWTEHRPDGSFDLIAVGDIRPASPDANQLGRFGDSLVLARVETDITGDTIHLLLYWRPLAPAEPADTIFVHLLNSESQLVAQADGEGLGGLLPPSAWRPGDEIEDRRQIILAEPLPAGLYRLSVGLYSRLDGRRYPAYDPDGTLLPDQALPVWEDILPDIGPVFEE
jgi:hypothetical protein